jgi:hypothetical protein
MNQIYVKFHSLISNNKSDHHDMTEMLLIVTLSTINEAIIYFRPVMLAKFGDPGYSACLQKYHQVLWS